MIKPTFLRRVAIAALLSGSCFSAAAAPPAPPVSYGVEEDVFHPVRAKQGMVASVDATATQVGVDILKEGGNAVDAAVAVGYALAVTHPQAGNLGGDANAVGPNKRPLSSMSPTIVVKDGKTWLVTGSPGGSRIITTVLQMVVNSIDYGMNVAEATNAPRFHHQWLPDELRVEKGFSPDTLKLLEAKGQKVALKEAMGSTQSIMVGPDGELYGASDPRSVDDLTAGY